jgi:hypothetical protein
VWVVRKFTNVCQLSQMWHVTFYARAGCEEGTYNNEHREYGTVVLLD